MACTSTVARDFLKSNLELDHHNCNKRIKDKGLAEHMVQDDTSHHEKQSLEFINNMAQSIGMFRNGLLEKSQDNLGKRYDEETKSILHHNFGDGFCPQSLLEQKLLPALKHDGVSAGENSSKAPLTIFYSGTVSVYDDLPIEKAQAMMLLAAESYLKAPMATSKANYTPKVDMTKPLQSSNLPSVCKLQADLPIARKYSLQRFLEKRRDRITNKSLYAPPSPGKKLTEYLESSSTDVGLVSLQI